MGDDIDGNTEKAISLIRAGLYSASHYVPLEEKRVEVTKSALVIGGGVSGLSAALFLSTMGMHVFLVEKEAILGGHVRALKDFWPVRKDGAAVMEADGRGACRTGRTWRFSRPTAFGAFEGSFGNYAATLDTPAGREAHRRGRRASWP